MDPGLRQASVRRAGLARIEVLLDMRHGRIPVAAVVQIARLLRAKPPDLKQNAKALCRALAVQMERRSRPQRTEVAAHVGEVAVAAQRNGRLEVDGGGERPFDVVDPVLVTRVETSHPDELERLSLDLAQPELLGDRERLLEEAERL